MTNPSTSREIAIVGGGLLGLTLAWRLAQSGRKVSVYEAAPYFGGLASAWSVGDFVWDRHYHVTLLSDSHLRSLLAELSLESELRWRKTQTGFFTAGRMHPMSNAWAYLRLPVLGPLAKARLAFTILYGARDSDLASLDRCTAMEWLTRLSGPRAVQRFWRPLLESKLGANAERVSAVFIQATIARLYAARRSGLKEELFGYVPGGYARILEIFAQRLRDLGVTLHPNHSLASITSGPCLRFTNSTEIRPAAAILTIPPPAVAKLCPSLSPEEHAAFARVEYQGIVCASVVLSQPLSPYYVSNLADPGFPFTGIIDMTALVDPAEFGGRGLVYLPRYAAPDDPIWKESDQEIRARFLPALARAYPGLSAASVLDFRVSRVPHVFALPLPGSALHPPARMTSLPGLFCVNSAQIVNGTLNVNETVLLANRAAAELPLP